MKLEYLASILDALNDMVRVVTREGKVAYTNKAFDKKMSFNRSTVGEFCYEIFGNQEQCDGCVSREAIATGSRRPGKRFHNGRLYSITASPIRDEETGQIVGAVEVFRDITLDTSIRNNLVEQNSKMRRDLQMAREVQQALVKGVVPKVEGYEVVPGFFPCEAVGGDIYDCMTSGDKLILYVADASGHGVMPAMLGVFFSRAVRAACVMGLTNPADILSHVQREFHSLKVPDYIYITGFIVVLEVPTGDFTYANAGLSVEPLVYHQGTLTELFMSAPPICHWFEDPVYTCGMGHLDPSDRLLIYSDGISEVQIDEKVQRQFYDLFCAKDFDCEEFIRKVKRDMFRRPMDDLTMLLCVRKPVHEGVE